MQKSSAREIYHRCQGTFKGLDSSSKNHTAEFIAQ